MESIIFDIETGSLPEPELAPFMPEFEANKTLKDPDKIRMDLLKKGQDWLNRAALSPLTGRVLCIGLLSRDKMFTCHGNTEKDILESFWTDWKNSTAPFVGWWCRAFDIPFLIRRSWKHGVAVPGDIMQGRYLSDRIIDLSDVWGCGQKQEWEPDAKRNKSRALGTVAKFLGVGEKTGNGADFAQLWLMDRPAALKYLEQDLKLTAAIWKKLMRPGTSMTEKWRNQ